MFTRLFYSLAPVESLSLAAANYSGELTTGFQPQEENKHSRKITMIENTLNPLRCTARGGYPAPELSVGMLRGERRWNGERSYVPL